MDLFTVSENFQGRTRYQIGRTYFAGFVLFFKYTYIIFS